MDAPNQTVPNCLILLLFVQCARVSKRQLPNPGGQKTFAFGIASFSFFADGNVVSR